MAGAFGFSPTGQRLPKSQTQGTLWQQPGIMNAFQKPPGGGIDIGSKYGRAGAAPSVGGGVLGAGAGAQAGAPSAGGEVMPGLKYGMEEPWGGNWPYIVGYPDRPEMWPQTMSARDALLANPTSWGFGTTEEMMAGLGYAFVDGVWVKLPEAQPAGGGGGGVTWGGGGWGGGSQGQANIPVGLFNWRVGLG